MNFRSGRVGYEFVSTSLDEQQRRDFALKLDQWKEVDDESVKLKGIVEELLEDWGAFLEASLYLDAIVHCFGGMDRIGTFVDIQRCGEIIGRQKFNMLNAHTAFFVTAIKHRLDYRKHLTSLVHNSEIECVQWINFDKHNVEFVTVS